MKLNNKGFAISTVMYMILIMAVILITLTLTLLSSRKLILDKSRQEASNNIYNVYDISYRDVLEILKSEAIEYAEENNIEKDSIKVSDLNSSVEKEILDGYKLSEKYLTLVSDNNLYDVYLGKSSVVTTNETIDNLIDIIDYKIEGNSVQETYTGKNLLNVNEITSSNITINDSDVQVKVFASNSSTSTGLTLQQLCPDLEVGKTYILSFNSDYGDSAYISVGSFSNTNFWGNGTTRTITETDLTAIIRLGTVGNTSARTVTFSNIQVELGSKVTKYEPYVGGVASPNPDYPQAIQSVGDLVTDSSDDNYGKYKISVTISENNSSTPDMKQVTTNIYLDQPLRKIGGYKDHINFENQKEIRQIQKLDLSNHVWHSYNKGYTFYYISGFKPLPLTSNSDVSLSNILPTRGIVESSDLIGIHAFSSGIIRVRPDLTVYDTVEKWQEYINNNESYIVYQTADIPKDIDLPKISTGLGYDSIIEVDTNIKPNSVEFTVIQKIKQI